MRKKRGKLFSAADRIDIVKIVVSALVMAGVILCVYLPLKNWARTGIVQSLAAGAAAGLAGIAAYAAAMFISGESEIKGLLKK